MEQALQHHRRLQVGPYRFAARVQRMALSSQAGPCCQSRSQSGPLIAWQQLLEVAAGSGAWMDFWNTQGVTDYLGIDLSERAIDGLKRRFPQYRFLQRDLNDPGLANAVGVAYDCVSAIDVLYHVIDDERFRAVVADLASVLKPDGLLIIHEQFLHGPARDHGYIRWRSLRHYEEVLNTAGFEILAGPPSSS
ncbi:MAG: class I SAM-dependent methyltransferase [Rhodoferax sp.]|nr:class I SAM-dependent methyltransferase [Rhodoferax sp.]